MRAAHAWKESDEQAPGYEFVRPQKLKNAVRHVGLFLSLSGKIEEAKARKAAPDLDAVYEIGLKKPDHGFLRSRDRLVEFRQEFRKLVNEIVKDCGTEEITVHLFAAVPAPVAVACGHTLSPNSDPKFEIYSYSQGEFTRALTVYS